MDEHHLPIFFQSPWTGADGCLNRHSLRWPRSRPKRLHPAGFGYLSNYTAFADPVPPGLDKNSFELETRILDNDAARIRDKMLAGVKPSPQEHLRWAQFLWFMRIREPERVALSRTVGESAAIEHFSRDPEQYEAVRGPDDPDNMLDFMRKHSPGLLENAGLLFMWDMLNDTKAHTSIARLPYRVIDVSGDERTLILGDRPLLLLGDLRESKIVLGIPMSPTRAFIASDDQGIRDRISAEATSDLILRFNEESLKRARKYVFTCDDSNVDLIMKIADVRKDELQST